MTGTTGLAACTIFLYALIAAAAYARSPTDLFARGAQALAICTCFTAQTAGVVRRTDAPPVPITRVPSCTGETITTLGPFDLVADDALAGTGADALLAWLAG